MMPRLGPLASPSSVAALLLLSTVATAWPQSQPPQPSLGVQEQPAQAPPQVQPAPQPAPENPGLIDEMGRLIDRIKPSIKSPSETLDDLNARARDAGEAISRLAKPGSMVTGRSVCPMGAGGTPDCKAGADKLCQGKGYKEGKSLNTDSAETCSAKVLIPGRQRKPDDCRTDTFVTTALCL
jgi:hypothetical protein